MFPVETSRRKLKTFPFMLLFPLENFVVSFYNSDHRNLPLLLHNYPIHSLLQLHQLAFCKEKATCWISYWVQLLLSRFIYCLLKHYTVLYWMFCTSDYYRTVFFFLMLSEKVLIDPNPRCKELIFDFHLSTS